MASTTITVRLSEMDRFRLFVWELRQLHDEMRIGASPHAERLEHLIDRFVGGDPEPPDEADPA